MSINAQTVRAVNAHSNNPVRHDYRMGKQPESDPSPFWRRLTESWERRGLPVSQNGVAMKLDMSQGSTRRWFTGDGYPETKVLREIAQLGGVTIDWLLMETLPRQPINPRSTLGRFLEVWDQMDEAAHEHLIRAARGQLALKPVDVKCAPPSCSSASKTAKAEPPQAEVSVF